MIICQIVNGRSVSINIFIETEMMICTENAGNLAGCCMFPDMENAIVSLAVRFIVVGLLDPFVVVVELLYR